MNQKAPTVKDLFDHAHELSSAAERQAYLDQACAGDAELRRQVEALLRAHDAAGSFLDGPALPMPATVAEGSGEESPATGPYSAGNTPPEPDFSEAPTVPPRPAGDGAAPGEGPGARLGPYRLVEEIGHGGMGAVYLAEQEEPVRRRVALKIIKPGMDSAQVVARFEAERQALALMDHLNIARVLDAGATPEGRPYFVMELVQGVPITRFCDDHHLTVRERLELFVPVCQAIQHAHQKGIIHRDIKPSNILVTLHEGKPFPKVIDFGIAKAIGQPLTERSPQTQIGTLIGTLEYMSPEQADFLGLGVDTRTDVYSLGVVLYELLTGTTPLDRSRLQSTPLVEVLRQIMEEEPPRCSTRVSGAGKLETAVAERRKSEPAKLARQLRGDLDWITAKALEKDRDRRYDTAVGLARDVQRHLADEPVEARPPSARYRLGKLVRKHRALVAFGSSLVAILLLALGGVTAGMVVARRALHEKGTALGQAHAALDMSDLALRAALRAKNQVGEAERINLRKVLQDYRPPAEDPGRDEEARAVAAKVEFHMAAFARLAGEDPDAEPAYRRAIRLYEGLAQDFPRNAGYRQGLAHSHYNVGLVLYGRGNRTGAEAAFRRAVELHEKLVADHPDEPLYRADLADDLNDLGVVLIDRGQRADAEKLLRQAITIREKLLAQFPDSFLYQANLGASCGNLGNAVRDQGDPRAALEWYGKAVERLGPIVARGVPIADARSFLRNAHWDRAHALGRLGRYADAAKDWQRAYSLDDGSDRSRIGLFLQAAQEEDRLKAIAPGSKESASGGRFFTGARVLAAAAAAAAKDEEMLSKHYAGRALELLQQARTDGFFRDAHGIEDLKKDAALKLLGQRPEFQKFVAGLAAGVERK